MSYRIPVSTSWPVVSSRDAWRRARTRPRRSRSSESPEPGRKRGSRFSRNTALTTVTEASRCTTRPAAPSRKCRSRTSMSILLTGDTRFIIQGITGREAINLTRENLDYGAKIVGGVTPGRAGRDVYGVPVYDCVRDAVAANGGSIEGSIVSVPPRFTQDAIIEALENDIKLIVVVTENVPRRQVAVAVELAKLRGARIIGPNCLGIISPDECKMGGVGGPAANTRQAYKKGHIGVMSRSGGMTTEIASTLTAAGLGQSTCISIGGDAIVGTTYAELMPFFEADKETHAIAIYSEPGGRMEAELAEWVKQQESRLPIIAFMAGRFMDEMKGMRFGHAGTIVEGKEDTTAEKIKRMEESGILVAERIEEIPNLIRQGLARKKR
ncbi:MAG: succinate--CoA ligase subunit alpha [Deltaproteobacteria bacterium]|nr:succinate--CoA ligase subunit alpha [Deltaproteobacteria bacterium]